MSSSAESDIEMDETSERPAADESTGKLKDRHRRRDKRRSSDELPLKKPKKKGKPSVNTKECIMLTVLTLFTFLAGMAGLILGIINISRATKLTGDISDIDIPEFPNVTKVGNFTIEGILFAENLLSLDDDGISIEGITINNGVISAPHVIVTNSSSLETDTIRERTANAGVTVDSVLLKDGTVQASQLTNDAAMTIGTTNTNSVVLQTNGAARVTISNTAINIPMLTASQLLATDASKNLVSVSFSGGSLPSTVVQRDVNGYITVAGTYSTAGTGASGVGHWNLKTTSDRWILGLIDTEAASNVGSNFAIWNHDNAGGVISKALSIVRASGAVNIASLTASQTVVTDASKKDR